MAGVHQWGGGVLHDNNNDDTYMTPLGRSDLQSFVAEGGVVSVRHHREVFVRHFTLESVSLLRTKPSTNLLGNHTGPARTGPCRGRWFPRLCTVIAPARCAPVVLRTRSLVAPAQQQGPRWELPLQACESAPL